jgi:hypothetical protein
MSEKEFVEKLTVVFQKQFHVLSEVKSICNSARIDLVLIHKQNPKYVFGIECKRFDRKKGAEIGKYIKQAMRYSGLKFEVYGHTRHIPILIAPPLSYKYFIMVEETKIDKDGTYWHKDRHDPDFSHHSMNGFLGEFNIGEVRSWSDKSYSFIFSNYELFESEPKRYMTGNNYGIHPINYSNIIKKISKNDTIL